MESANGYRPKSQIKIKHVNGSGIVLNSNTLLVIKLPSSRVLRVVSRSVFLALVILTLPCIGSIIRGSPSSSFFNDSDFISIGSDWVGFESLADEGLLKKGGRAIVVSSGIGDLIDNSLFLNDNEIELVMESDLDRQGLIPDETFDFAFTSSFQATKFVDRVLKIGGIVAVQFSNNPSNAFLEQSNYKIVYLRRFDSTIVAMRKTGRVDELVNSKTKRRWLCAPSLEAKKAALKGLEDPLLEPPRRALAKSKEYLKNAKYLPDLLGDSLEGYRRRIFINLGLPEKNSGSMEWFYQNYPTRNQHFEIYNLETATEESSDDKVASLRIGISDWLMKNVREEEYVVMKAEAEVVEEMIKGKTICLVDELFLECKNQWQGGEANKSKRAYWECLALYGKLRDEGVAVHQWWG